MDDGAIQLEDVYDAVRLLRRQERSIADGEPADEELVAELQQYIDVMTSVGLGEPDTIKMLPPKRAADQTEIAHVAVSWPTPSGLWRAVRRNINKSGVFLATEQTLPIDTTFDLEVTLLHPSVHFIVPAKVIWANPQTRAGRPAGMGLKFLWASPNDPSIFRSFVVGDGEATELAALGAPHT